MMKRSKQFRGKTMPIEPVDEWDRSYRKEPEPAKIQLRKGARPQVPQMRAMKKRAVGRGR